MLHAVADLYEQATDESIELDDTELLQEVGMLRDELRSLRSEIREQTQRRAKLTQKSDSLRGGSNCADWRSESQRVIDDVNELMRRYEAATSPAPRRVQSADLRPSHSARARVYDPRARSTPPAQPCSRPRFSRDNTGPEVKPDFFKKMFMFMMSELA